MAFFHLIFLGWLVVLSAAMPEKRSHLGPRPYDKEHPSKKRTIPVNAADISGQSTGLGSSLEGGSSSSSSNSQVPPAPPLKEVLKDMFLRNKNSGVDIQKVAHSAEYAGASSIHDVAKAGSYGKFPNNAPRDIMRAMLKGCTMPPIAYFPVPIWDSAGNVRKVEQWPFLLPHEMLYHMASK
jgi:hypothetical protein